jgi:hypothetical protein
MSEEGDEKSSDYDPELDVILDDFGGAIEGTDLLVQLVSYDGGEEKIRIGRISKSKGKKVGRFLPMKRIALADFLLIAQHVLDQQEEG